MECLPTSHHSRYRNGVDPKLWHLVNSPGCEKVRCQSSRSPTARVQTVDVATRGFVVDHEQVTAYAIHHRLHQSNYSICSDRGINSIAAVFQNLNSGSCCQRLTCRYDAISRGDYRTSGNWQRSISMIELFCLAYREFRKHPNDYYYGD